MIIVYPMLCSNTVNYSAIPGVAKAMERYILIHKLDDILKANRKKFAKSRGRIQLKEDSDFINDSFYNLDEDIDVDDSDIVNISENEVEIICEAQKEKSPASRMTPEQLDEEIADLKKEQQKVEDEKRKMEIDKKIQQLNQKKEEIKAKKSEIRDASLKVNMQMDSLSLEPTWMYADRIVDGNKVNDLIGVKVLPFIVQSDEKLVNLMAYDKNLKKFDAAIVGFGRSVKKKIFDMYENVVNRIPGVRHFLGKRGTIKGDPKRDVILAMSSFRDNVFVCVNKLDFEDDFFQSTKNMNQLFNLGWGSIIAMDDSQKTAYFCVQEFKGICFPVQYGYIFSTLGKDHGKVFEDLNDVKKSSGGIFKRKIPRRKLFENEIYSKYLNDSSIRGFAELEKIILTENVGNKNEAKGVIRGIKDFLRVLETGDEHKIQASLKRKTKYKNASEVKKDLSKVPGFKKGYDLGKSKLKKKLDFHKINSNRMIELIAILVGIYAVRDYASNTMSSMKYSNRFIDKIKEKIDENVTKIKNKIKDEDYDSDYVLGMALFGTVCMMIAPVVITVLYVIITNPGFFVGFIKLVYGSIMFILYSIFFILSTVVESTVRLGSFLIDFAGDTKMVFDKIGSFFSYIHSGMEKAVSAEEKLRQFLSLDWIF